MLRHGRWLVVLCTLALFSLPVFAQQRVDRLPAIKEFMAARFEGVMVVNGQPLIVARGEFSSPQRAHFVLRQLPVGGAPSATLEIVVYDGKIYVRQDNDTQWYIVEDELPVPVGPAPPQPGLEGIEGAPITHIGSMNIAGTPTNQYQVWINTPGGEGLDYAKIDLWIGQAVNYLYQGQVTLVGRDPELGPLQIEFVARFYDFEDRSIVVGPPANAIPVGVTGHRFAAPLRVGGVFATLSAPLSVPRLRSMAIERLQR